MYVAVLLSEHDTEAHAVVAVAGDDAQCCCYGYFQGGEATAEFEELLRRDNENKRRADIVFVLDELEKHYAQYKPELVGAVRSVKESYK